MTNLEAFRRQTLGTVDPIAFLDWLCSAQGSCENCLFHAKKPEWYKAHCIRYWFDQEFDADDRQEGN